MPYKNKKNKLEYSKAYRKIHQPDKMYYLAHRQEILTKQKLTRHSRGLLKLQMFGNKCLICGELKQRSLVLHEIHGKSHPPTHLRKGLSYLAKHRHDFVLLCRACHRRIHWIMRYYNLDWESLERVRKDVS